MRLATIVAGNHEMISLGLGDSAAIVPTPISDTSLTLMRASRFAFFRS